MELPTTYSRRQHQALRWWTPGSPYSDKRILLAVGAVRSGKTTACILSFLIWSMASFDKQNFILAGKTIQTLRRNVIEPLKQMALAMGFHLEERIASGTLIIQDAQHRNTYYLYDANNESSQDRLQGLTAAGALADEVALFPENFVYQMLSRCSVPGNRLFMCCNPMGPLHFMKTEFIERPEELRLLPMTFTLMDNPGLDPQTIEDLKKSFTGVFYRRNILGEWALADGVIFPDFDPSVHHLTEVPHLEHVIVSADFGMNHAMVFLILGSTRLAGKTHIYVLKEYYYNSSTSRTVGEHVQRLKEFTQGYAIQSYVIDPSALALKTEVMAQRIGMVLNAKNDVLPGLATMGDLFRNQRIHIDTKECPMLVKELQSYAWDPKAQQQGKDAPLKVFDDACDALRYGIMALVPKYERNWD